MKRKVTIALLTIGGFYIVLCLAMYFFQGVMLFPGAQMGDGKFDKLPNVRVETLRTAQDIEYRIAIATPGIASRGVMLCFLGNGESLSSGVYRAAQYAEYGYLTLVTEYPGYGASEGSPSHRSFLAAADASAARGQELAKANKLPLLVLGQSIGAFSAVHLAAKGIGEKLVLISPPTSIAAAARSRFPFLPVGLLLRHPFDNLAHAASIGIPTLVVHGERDNVVDVAMGRELAAAIPGAKLHIVAGAGHNNMDLSLRGKLGGVLVEHLSH